MTSYENRRKNDVKLSQIVERFCDKEIYMKLPFSIHRVTDKNQQLKGIDLLWDNKKVDEKVAIKYINRNLTTFAFELSSLNNHNENGWFNEDSYLETTHYLIGYLKGDLNAERIDEVELLLIDKKTIWDYLKKHNFDKAIVRKIRMGQIESDRVNEYGGETFFISVPGAKIVHSTGFSESPINIVINRIILTKLSEMRIVYKNGKMSY